MHRRGVYRQVPLWFAADFMEPMEFEEMRVRKPLLAVSYLEKLGVRVHFADDGDPDHYLLIRGHKIPMHQKNGIYVIKAQVKSPAEISALPEHPRATWCIVEWASWPDSELTEAFVRLGHTGRRLGLHNANLAKTEDVRQAALMVNDIRAAGYYVMIWASLPCGPWSTWQ